MLALCWFCAGFVLALCWLCAGFVLAGATKIIFIIIIIIIIIIYIYIYIYIVSLYSAAATNMLAQVYFTYTSESQTVKKVRRWPRPVKQFSR